MSQEGRKPQTSMLEPPELDPDDEPTDPSIVVPKEMLHSGGVEISEAPVTLEISMPQLEPAEIVEPGSSKTSTNIAQLKPKTGSPSPAAPSPAPRPMTGRAAPAGASPAPPAPPRPGGPAKMPEMGPLDALMRDPTITEIMVNDLRNVMVEKDGKMMFSGFTYSSIDELNRLTRNILDFTGRLLSPDLPYVDVMLPDGSRVNIVAPPLTLNGPCLTIRKFPGRRPTVDDLMANGTLDRRMAYFLNVCVMGRLNILISGGTDTGKTTLLNVLSQFIPKPERVVTIEDTPELVVNHPNSVKLQTKPQTPASAPVTARDLVANSLRMRPDRIIVGECRKGEAFDMLQAMNTGHMGSMTTIHANSTRDALTRLETLCMLAGVDLPVLGFRRQISSAVDLVIQLKRFRSGRRRIVSIAEITGMEGEVITMQDIFHFEIPHKSGAEEAGVFKCTGFVPTFIDSLHEQGIDFPEGFFS